MTEPIAECEYCGTDLYLNEPHDCPIGGNVILIAEETPLAGYERSR